MRYQAADSPPRLMPAPQRNQLRARTRMAMGSRLKAAREASGLTQMQVQHRSGVTQGKLSDLERGRRPLLLTDAVALADAYGLVADVLCDPTKTAEEVAATIITLKARRLRALTTITP